MDNFGLVGLFSLASTPIGAAILCTIIIAMIILYTVSSKNYWILGLFGGMIALILIIGISYFIYTRMNKNPTITTSSSSSPSSSDSD
jgi:uncharacterized protein YqhQ